jgi:hypothetical protein
MVIYPIGVKEILVFTMGILVRLGKSQTILVDIVD